MIGREQADNLAFTLLRIGAGIIVIPHGVSQLIGGNASFAQSALNQNRCVAIALGELFNYLSGTNWGCMPRSRFFVTRFCRRFGGRNDVGSSNILVQSRIFQSSRVVWRV
jgi:hypothetical protein